jgi:hypothetical protein
MADGESPSFSAGEVGNVVGSVIGGLIGGALGPAGSMVGAAVGGKAGSAAGNAMSASGGTNTGGTAASDNSLDDFAVNDGYGPGALGPSTAPGSMPDVVQSMVDAAPGAGGDMGTINRNDPPPMSAPSAELPTPAPSITNDPPVSVTNDVMPPAAPAAPVTPPVTPASLADNRGPMRVIRGRGARRLLLYDAQSPLGSTLGGA